LSTAAVIVNDDAEVEYAAERLQRSMVRQRFEELTRAAEACGLHQHLIAVAGYPHHQVLGRRRYGLRTCRTLVRRNIRCKPWKMFTSDSSAATPGYAVGYQDVEYPHVQRRQIIKPAEAALKIVDVKIAPALSVGYVNGVGDQVPPAIEQLGAKLTFIDQDELAWGDLSKYNVIVTGVRAYERRADLRAYNRRLLDYVEQGGTVLVQYNKFEFNQSQYGPYPASVSGNRVSDESVPVKVLVPAHPAFNYPNKVGPATWSNWVQERGLYFLGEKDPRYVDLVSMNDSFQDNPGDKLGSLVEARVGKGRWLYLGLGLWRQLPAGTDGAYQLLANLLSLPKAP
jgi:hypothetical protein